MNVKEFFGKIFRGIKEHSSDVKMIVGTSGVIGGTVVLCKEAVKVSKIIEEYKEAKQELIDYEAEKKDIRNLKLKTAGKVVVTCLPGATLEGAGLVAMWSGYSDVKVALVGVGAAYAKLQDFTNKYREGVREKYGEEVDEQLAYQFRTEEVVTKDENGNDKVETIRIYPHDVSKLPSPYARYFEYGEAEGAEKSFDYNLKFLQLQESLANTRFRAHRKTILNDVHDMLGYKRTKSGGRVGWVYDPEAPEGDNRIDFRIQVVYREKLDEFGNSDGWYKTLLIDPNVDGMVEDKMIRMGLMDE